MGDDHEGDPDLVLQAHQLELHLLAQLLVERRERLVEQQHLGPLDQRAGERDALALAAGELIGLALLEALEPDHRQRALTRGPISASDPADLEAVGDVLGDVMCGNTA